MTQTDSIRQDVIEIDGVPYVPLSVYEGFRWYRQRHLAIPLRYAASNHRAQEIATHAISCHFLPVFARLDGTINLARRQAGPAVALPPDRCAG